MFYDYLATCICIHFPLEEKRKTCTVMNADRSCGASDISPYLEYAPSRRPGPSLSAPTTINSCTVLLETDKRRCKLLAQKR